MASRGPGDGYAGGCRRVQGPPEFSQRGDLRRPGILPARGAVLPRCGLVSGRLLPTRPRTRRLRPAAFGDPGPV